jgi:hypothetical protein
LRSGECTSVSGAGMSDNGGGGTGGPRAFLDSVQCNAMGIPDRERGMEWTCYAHTITHIQIGSSFAY